MSRVTLQNDMALFLGVNPTATVKQATAYFKAKQGGIGTGDVHQALIDAGYPMPINAMEIQDNLYSAAKLKELRGG